MFHRVARVILEGIAVLAAVAVVAAGLAAWRLAEGPIPVEMLRPLADRLVQDGFPGHVMAFETAELFWDAEARGLALRVRGLAVDGPRGGRIAEIGAATLRVAPKPLLLGQIKIIGVRFEGATLRLERGADAALRLAGPHGDTWTLVRPEDTGPGADAAAGSGPALADSLEEVAIVGARIEFADAPTHSIWQIEDAALVFRRRDAVRTLSGSLHVRRDGFAVPMLFTGRMEGPSAPLGIDLAFRGLRPEWIADLAPGAAALDAFDMAFDGEASLRLGPDLVPISARLSLDSRGGRITDAPWLPGAADLTAARLRLDYAAAQRHLTIEGLELGFAGGGHGTLAGSARFGNDGTVEFEARAALRDVPVDSLPVFWPLELAPKGRRWVTANLSRGLVEEALFDFAVAQRPGEAVRATRLAGSVRFRGVEVNYIGQMPHAVGVDGSAILALDRVDVLTVSGMVGALRVEEVRTALTGFDRGVETAEIRLVVRGPVRDQLQLIDHPPLGLMRNLTMPATDFSGEALTRARFVFPLVADLKVDQVGISGSVEARGFGLRRAALGRDARDGELAGRFDETGFSAVGRLMLGPTPIELDYMLPFRGSEPVRERIRASLTLPARDMVEFGIDLAPYVDGPLPLSLDYASRRGGSAELRLEVALEAARLAIPELAWEKAAGVAGSARLDLLLERGRLIGVRNLRIAAGDGDAGGRVTMTPDGTGVQSVELDRARFGRNDVRVMATRIAGGWRLRLSGAALDLSPLAGENETATEDVRARPRLEIEAALARVWLERDRSIAEVALRGIRTRQWDEIQLAATGHDRHGRAGRFNLDLGPDGRGGTRLNLRSGDAGAALAALGVTDKIVGGTLEATGATDPTLPDRPLAIDLRLRSYRLVEEPAVARFLAAALLTGLLDMLQGEGIGFDRLEAKILWRDNAMDIRDLRTSGPALGMQGRGRIDRAANRIDMDGVIVPANAINSLFSRIPIIGEILFGPGLFAARVSVRGARDAPDITVNPLSALAPGVLRNIFGIFEGPPSPANDVPGASGAPVR